MDERRQVELAASVARAKASKIFASDSPGLAAANKYIDSCVSLYRERGKTRWKRKGELADELVMRSLASGRKAEQRAKRIGAKKSLRAEQERLQNSSCSHAFVHDKQSRTCRYVCSLCGNVNRDHVFCAHPTRLYKIQCLHCVQFAASSRHESQDNKLLRYLSARRKLRFLETLFSLSLPMAAPSVALVKTIMAQLDIVSNTGVLHVTLLEGAVSPHENYRQQVGQYLNQDNSCHVLAVQMLPTVDPALNLVIVHVQVPAWTAAQRVTATATRLPPWTMLHMALGTIPRESATAIRPQLESLLVGQHLYTNPDLLAWLGPNVGISATNGSNGSIDRGRPSRLCQTSRVIGLNHATTRSA